MTCWREEMHEFTSSDPLPELGTVTCAQIIKLQTFILTKLSITVPILCQNCYSIAILSITPIKFI